MVCGQVFVSDSSGGVGILGNSWLENLAVKDAFGPRDCPEFFFAVE